MQATDRKRNKAFCKFSRQLQYCRQLGWGAKILYKFHFCFFADMNLHFFHPGNLNLQHISIFRPTDAVSEKSKSFIRIEQQKQPLGGKVGWRGRGTVENANAAVVLVVRGMSFFGGVSLRGRDRASVVEDCSQVVGTQSAGQATSRLCCIYFHAATASPAFH